MSKTDKVVDALECAASSGKLPRQLKTNCAFSTACECVKSLRANGSATCIQSDVRDFFVKMGFRVEEEGIGWRISA